MYTQTSNTAPAPSVIRNYFARGGWPFQRRHPEVWAAVRALLVLWFVTLGTILCSHGYGWGALVYLGAVKELAFGYRLLKTSRARQQ